MTECSPIVGIIGVGHLVRHLLPGLMRAADPPKFLLSPRGRETSKQLHARFGTEIAKDNADVLRRSNRVLLAVRPFQVDEALSGLPWRADQTVISLMAGITAQHLSNLTNGAKVVRAMPVVAAEFGESATSLYPPDDGVKKLFEPAGHVTELTSEAAFETASVFGATYGWLQALGAELTDWLTAQGLAPDQARQIAAQTMRASGTTLLMRPETSPHDLVKELTLPGSITGLGLEQIKSMDGLAPWTAACDVVLKKLNA